MWEGIGVVSFLLISFWYTRIQAVKSAIQALTMNRVGDMMLSIGLFAMFALFGNLDYSTVFSTSPYVNEIAITIVVLLLFIGATAKSAQVPLHVWLPGSMEGLIILLLIFTNYFYNFSPIPCSAATATDGGSSGSKEKMRGLFFFKIMTISRLPLAIPSVPYGSGRLVRDRGAQPNLMFLDRVSCNSFLFLRGFSKARDSKGRFLPGSTQILEPLSNNLLEALYGDLLGDGHLRFNKKGKDDLPKPNTNAQLAITLKSKEHINHLWKDVYSEICTSVGPHPWPNPKTGKPVTQYHLASRALPSLSEIHKEWYILNDKKFVKIVPLNIKNLLTARSIAF